MNALFARARVVLGSTVTWLLLAATILTVVLDELATVDGIPTWVGGWITKAITIIGVAVAIIRRVTPVLPDDRGLLAKPHDDTQLVADAIQILGYTADDAYRHAAALRSQLRHPSNVTVTADGVAHWHGQAGGG